MQNKSEMINRIAELAEENAELKAKIKKYAELNEIDTRDYAALHNENAKLNAIIDSYQPRLQALTAEIAELQAYKDVNEDFKTAWEQLKDENERLKEEIKEVKKYQYQQEYLDKEIEEMQKALKTLAEGLNIRQQTLQEIKAIAKAPSPYIDNFEIKTATEVGYDYAAICNELELRLHKVLELITKAEEE